MKIQVLQRSGKLMDTFECEPSTTVEDFKQLVYKKSHYYPERQRLTIGSPKGVALKDGSSLKDSGVQDGCSLYFKDLGIQMSWRLVFVIEYFGPIFIMPLFWFLSPWIYSAPMPSTGRSFPAKLAFVLFVLHFVKREFETLFIHRFSNATMPIQRLPINCGHYWVLCACAISYFLCHPLYHAPFQSPLISLVLGACMLGCEVMNLNAHVILRNLRPRNSKVRGIPNGCGFQWVSCANYFWETLSWVFFSLLVNCLTSWLFTAVAFAQMSQWALKKHRNYKKEFPDYPKSRKAIIPGLL